MLRLSSSLALAAILAGSALIAEPAKTEGISVPGIPRNAGKGGVALKYPPAYGPPVGTVTPLISKASTVNSGPSLAGSSYWPMSAGGDNGAAWQAGHQPQPVCVAGQFSNLITRFDGNIGTGVNAGSFTMTLGTTVMLNNCSNDR